MELYANVSSSSQILFPLADLANHDPEAKRTWKVDKSSDSTNTTTLPVADSTAPLEAFQIFAEDEIPPGHEVFNNYGSTKYNSELLLGYGFCLPDMKNDYIAVEFTNAKWLETAHRIWEKRECYSSTNSINQYCLESGASGSGIKRRFVLGWETRSSTEAEVVTGIGKDFQMFEHGLFDLLAIELANTSEKAYIAENPSLCLETASSERPLGRLLLATTSAVVEKLEYDLRKILTNRNTG